MNIATCYRATTSDLATAFQSIIRRKVTPLNHADTSGNPGGGRSGPKSDNVRNYGSHRHPADDALAREIEALEDPERWDGLA